MERLEAATEGQSKNGFTADPTRPDEIPADAQKPVAHVSAAGGEIVVWRECPVLRDLEDTVGEVDPLLDVAP